MIGKETKLTIKTGGNFTPIPEGYYTVQIMDVELVRQMNQFKGEEQDMLNYRFAILNEGQDEEGQPLRGRYLWRRCSLSINKKSWLGKLLKAVFGRDLTEEEASKFHPDDLIGHQVDVMVKQEEAANGNTYSNIISFSPNKKTLEALPAEEEKEAVSTSVAATEKEGKKPPWENQK